MTSDITLFLRDPIPDERLLPALASVFGKAAQDDIRIVDYHEGFATGIGIAQVLDQPVEDATHRLARLLHTAVLLEAGDAGLDPAWLLFLPDRSHAQSVGVIEMRYGLEINPEARPRNERGNRSGSNGIKS